MRLPDPSTLCLVFPSQERRDVGLTTPLSPILSPLPPTMSPLGPTLPLNLDPSQFLLTPPGDANQPTSGSQNARRFDNVLYGDIPSRIDDDTTRFVLNNPNGVTRDGLYDHLTEFMLELLELGVDVIQLPESNIDWRHPNEFRKCRKAVTSVFKHAKLSTSSSIKRTVTAKQPGGTLPIGVDNFTGRIYKTGRDEKFGCWSFFKTNGQNGRSIVVIIVYQVCNQPVDSVGITTACKQQHLILDEQQRLVVHANGRSSPHPRKALIQDLSWQMRQWRSDGFEMILSDDLNEVLGDDPNEFAVITTDFNLTDIYRHRHGSDEPATYQRGQKRLDYMLCTADLLPAVTACGIMPFKILSPSDHRTIFVDFDTKLLFGSLPSELASPKAKAFHSRDYESSEKYIQTVHAYCGDHNL
jgi:hypothetical protein